MVPESERGRHQTVVAAVELRAGVWTKLGKTFQLSGQARGRHRSRWRGVAAERGFFALGCLSGISNAWPQAARRLRDEEMLLQALPCTLFAMSRRSRVRSMRGGMGVQLAHDSIVVGRAWRGHLLGRIGIVWSRTRLAWCPLGRILFAVLTELLSWLRNIVMFRACFSTFPVKPAINAQGV